MANGYTVPPQTSPSVRLAPHAEMYQQVLVANCGEMAIAEFTSVASLSPGFRYEWPKLPESGPLRYVLQ